MAKSKKLPKHLKPEVKRLRRILNLGAVAQIAGDEADADQLEAEFDRSFRRLPLWLQRSPHTEEHIVDPARAVMDEHGVLGVAELARVENWRADL